MRKILLAVDDTKGSVLAAETVAQWADAIRPESIVLLHVQKLLGRSLIGEGLESDPDIEEMSAALEGTEYQQKLDDRARKILSHHSGILERAGFSGIKPVIKQGHPAEVIIATAKDEGADLIIVGSRGGRRHDFLLGSVSREVANGADISVLIAH